MLKHALGASQPSQVYFVTGNSGKGQLCSVPLSLCSSSSSRLIWLRYRKESSFKVLINKHTYTSTYTVSTDLHLFLYFPTYKIVLKDTHLCIRFEDGSGSLH